MQTLRRTTFQLLRRQQDAGHAAVEVARDAHELDSARRALAGATEAVRAFLRGMRRT